MYLIKQICSINNIIDYIKTDKKYLNSNPYQKEKIIIQLFHSSNFEQLKTNDRIVILQELEKIEAAKFKMNPYKIVVLNSNYRWQDLLMDMGCDYTNKKFLIRKNYIEDGIGQKIVDGKVEEGKISFINIDLLECLFHEHYHTITKYYTLCLFDQKDTIYREHLEYKIWKNSLSSDDIKNLYNMDAYYVYRMYPDEYYAFKYSEMKVRFIFNILNKYYGYDKNLDNYFVYLENNKNKVLFEYNKTHDGEEIVDYDFLYNKFLNEYINNFLKNNKQLSYITNMDIVKDLRLRKSIFTKYMN